VHDDIFHEKFFEFYYAVTCKMELKTDVKKKIFSLQSYLFGKKFSFEELVSEFFGKLNGFSCLKNKKIIKLSLQRLKPFFKNFEDFELKVDFILNKLFINNYYIY